MRRFRFDKPIARVLGWVLISMGLGFANHAMGQTDNAPVVSASSGTGEVGSASERDWIQYRGHDANSTQHGATFPIQWSDTEGLLWKAEIPGRGSSSPIVVGDRVFITAHTGYGMSATERGLTGHLRYHLICKDRNTGETLWQRNIRGTMLSQRLNDTLLGHGFASHTPVTDGERVYVFLGATGVFAFDLDGELVWQQNVGTQFHFFGTSASLTIYKNLLVVNASIENDTIYAFDKSSGKGIWKIDDILRCYSLPVFAKTADGSTEMIVSEKDTVHGYDPETGKELWHCEGVHDYTVGVPIVYNGICYCNGGLGHQFMAIRIGGRGDVTQTHKLWEVPFGGIVGSPLLVDDVLFLADDSGVMVSYEAATGKKLNRRRTGKSERIFASLLLVDDQIFAPLQTDGVLVFKATADMPEITRNRFAESEGPIHSSLAANGDRAFIRTNRFLYCIGDSTTPPTTVKYNSADSMVDLIAPIPRVEFVKATNRLEPYCYYLSSDVEAVSAVLLSPYKSVITDSQRNQFVSIFQDNRSKYDELRARQKEAHWMLMTGEIDHDSLKAKLDAIGKETLALNGSVRMLLKKLFSEEQMAQHLKEAAEHRERQKQKWLEQQRAKKKQSQ